jgi:hypothetical protein
MSKIDQPKPIMHTHKHLRRRIPLRVAAFAVLVLMFVMIGAGIVTNQEDITNPGASASAAYPADINNDGIVGIADIAYVASKWGTSDVTADLTNDGTVGILDVSYIATRWGGNRD